MLRLANCGLTHATECYGLNTTPHYSWRSITTCRPQHTISHYIEALHNYHISFPSRIHKKHVHHQIWLSRWAPPAIYFSLKLGQFIAIPNLLSYLPSSLQYGWKDVSIVLEFNQQLITSACWLGLSLKQVVCIHDCSFSCMWVNVSLLLLVCLWMHTPPLEPRNFTKGTVHDNMHSGVFVQAWSL